MRKTLLAVCAAIALFAAINLQKGSIFPYAGRHEAYLLKDSSACQILSLSGEEANDKVFFRLFLKGESVTLQDSTDAGRLMKDFQARVVFEETADGVRSVYCYSPKIRGYKRIGGKKINLHIAYADGRTVAGTPIIFGGY